MNIRTIFDVLDTYFRGSAVLKPSYEDYEIDPNFCKVIQVEARFIFFLEIIGKMWEKSISIKGVRISSTFSVLPPFSYLRPFLYFDRSTSRSFDLLSNLDFLLVETYSSKYSFGRSKVGGSKYRKGRIYENGRSTE